MNILFIHQNFPAQFVHLSAALAAERGNRVVALAFNDNPAPPGVEVQRYRLLRERAPQTHALLAENEQDVLRAEACASAAMQLKASGFEPDVIYAHPGWGEALFIKDVFPAAKLLVYCEYYYSADAPDVDFDPEAPRMSFALRASTRMRNALQLLTLDAADAGIAPTHWQRASFPAAYQPKISVIHDGIDLAALQPQPHARLDIQQPGGGAIRLGAGDEVLSYVARSLEPLRGFPVFMRALPALQRQRPRAQTVIAGLDQQIYSYRHPSGRSWREQMLAELDGKLDLSRIHFVGHIPRASYLGLLNVAKAHCYLTTPFLLSWSFLEAAASGMPVIASDTPPVREFAAALQPQLLPFHDHGALGEALARALAAPRAPRLVRQAPEIELQACLARQKALIGSL
ncbi:glycosyltransferase [Massilia endophytica]|uniref:glycosyltransferase n=1 Tax=Massilia endophytica TaxID=2899220 RepID=UPI001E464195|nr:glycosyltransferase [Massilia endophytica]UGQ45245.1 glycosyltransferase [Massilia endophytica]